MFDDDDLRRAFDDLAGPSVDTYAALRELGPRLDNGRRRRLTVGTAVSAMAAAIALAVGVAAAARHEAGPPVKVVAPASASSDESTSTTTMPARVSTTTATSVEPSTTEPRPSVSTDVGVEESTIVGAGAESGHRSDATEGAAGGGEATGEEQAPSQGGAPHAGPPSTSARQGGVGPSTSTTEAAQPSSPTVSSATTAKPAPARFSYITTGGMITYLFDGVSISDVRLIVDPGWVGSIEREESDRVEVTFAGGDEDHRNKVNLRVRNGQVVAEHND